MIRNGQAHQYQQTIVQLKGGKFDVGLCGAKAGRGVRRKAHEHLRCIPDENGDLLLHVCPDVLFSDIKAAIQGAELLVSGTFEHFSRRAKITKEALLQVLWPKP